MVEWSASMARGTDYPDPHPDDDVVREHWAARRNIHRRLSLSSLEFDARQMEDLGEAEPWTPRDALAPLVWGSQVQEEDNVYVGPGSGMAQLPGKWNPGVLFIPKERILNWLDLVAEARWGWSGLVEIRRRERDILGQPGGYRVPPLPADLEGWVPPYAGRTLEEDAEAPDRRLFTPPRSFQLERFWTGGWRSIERPIWHLPGTPPVVGPRTIFDWRWPEAAGTFIRTCDYHDDTLLGGYPAKCEEIGRAHV